MRIDHAAQYARAVVDGTLAAPRIEVDGTDLAPRYVKLQCAEFLRMWDDENPKYVVNRKLLRRICRILSVLRMAKGPRTGKTVYEALAGYQWLIIAASTATTRKAGATSARSWRYAERTARPSS